MASFAVGDEASFARVYRLAAPAVYRALLRLCREPALAEDLTQETFLRMYRSRGAYRVNAKVLPWARTIARRLFLDRLRQRRSEEKLDQLFAGDELDASFAPRADEWLAALRMVGVANDVLERLPRRQAEAFRLVKEEGLSLAQVSEKLGETNLTIRLRTHRACQAIRAALAEHRG